MKRFFLLIILVVPLSAFASSIQIFTQSVNSLGYAHADMAALADDPSTAYYNPAGMTRLKCNQFSAGIAISDVQGEFRGRLLSGGQTSFGDTIISQLFQIFGISFDDLNIYLPRSQDRVSRHIPNFHAVLPLPNAPRDLTIGVSVVPTFAFETNYYGSIMTGYTEKARIETIAINPSVAFTLFPGFSVGFGYSLQKCSTQNSISILILGGEIKQKSWEMTGNVAALYEFNCGRTRFGMTYRPKVTHDLKGRTQFFDQDVKSKGEFILPGTVTAGFYHQLDCNFSIMGTMAYTMWNAINDITVSSDIDIVSIPLLGQDIEADLTKIVIPFNWENSFLIALGGNYRPDDKWLLKAGFAFDKSAATDNFRELKIPDQDRWHAAFGARYCLNCNWIFDFGYQYIYVPNARIRNNPFFIIPVLEDQGVDLRVNGTVKYHATVFGGQVTCRF